VIYLHIIGVPTNEVDRLMKFALASATADAETLPERGLGLKSAVMHPASTGCKDRVRWAAPSADAHNDDLSHPFNRNQFNVKPETLVGNKESLRLSEDGNYVEYILETEYGYPDIDGGWLWHTCVDERHYYIPVAAEKIYIPKIGQGD
jgi:hypothetical protein